jgi:hypothetical protein
MKANLATLAAGSPAARSAVSPAPRPAGSPAHRPAVSPATLELASLIGNRRMRDALAGMSTSIRSPPLPAPGVQFKLASGGDLGGRRSHPARAHVGEPRGDENIHAAALRGVATASSSLPFANRIQRLFGQYDISGIQAHIGPAAVASADAMGAHAYATGDHVVLGGQTDLHTVAHEAAHVVQQRGGVQLPGGVGSAGDAYELHADAVADAVVAGRSAGPLLDGLPRGGGAQRAVQGVGGEAHTDAAAARGAATIGARAFATDKSSQDSLGGIAGGHGAGGTHVVQRKAALRPLQTTPSEAESKGKKEAWSGESGAPSGPEELTKSQARKWLKGHGLLSGAGAGALYKAVLDSKPKAISKAVLGSQPKAISEGAVISGFSGTEVPSNWITSWLNFGTETYLYDDTLDGARKFLKDVFKYQLYEKHDWRSVGVAEYMTGDATGLSLAPIADERMTIKVLAGWQKNLSEKDLKNQPPELLEKYEPTFLNELRAAWPKNLSEKEWLQFRELLKKQPPELLEELLKKYGPTFLNKRTYHKDEDPEDQLPGYFDIAKNQDQIRFSKSAFKEKYGGTAELYRQRYNEHVPGPVKPWNKETHAATTAIGKGLKDVEIAKRLREPLKLGKSASDKDAKANIKKYKLALDEQIRGRKCVMLWGRWSGKKGGAHKELDSHRKMIEQLVDTLQRNFSDRVLVFVGDPVIGKDDARRLVSDERDILYLGEFWKHEEYGKYLNTRQGQRYFCRLFSRENDAVSIGMRSGSLEGMALLDMRVVFIDDVGNNAAERMEAWAGTAAEGRAVAYAKAPEPRKARAGTAAEAYAKPPEPREAWGDSSAVLSRAEYESKYAGPLPNYKRVATTLQLGDQVDARAKTLEDAWAALNRLHDNDETDVPICDEMGNSAGNKLIEDLNKELGALDDIGKPRVSAAPGAQSSSDAQKRRERIDQAYKKLEKLPDQLTPKEYLGTPAGSSYQFNRGDLELLIAKLEQRPDDDQVKIARKHLERLQRDRDAAGKPYSHTEPTSGAAKQLLKPLENKGVEGAKSFNDNYEKLEHVIPGVAKKGRMKFRTTDVIKLQELITRLQHNNVLQEFELDQVTSLVEQLAPSAPASRA